MEVLGVIAGLPGLIEIVQKTVEVASQLKNWKSLSDEMAILLQQLEGLENTLKGVQDRGASPSISPSQVARFQASLEKIRNDLTHLNSLLYHCNTINRKSGMQFMKKVKLLLTGFDKNTKKHIERIRDTRAELTLAIVGQVHQDSSPSRSKTDLLLQLEKTLCPSSNDFIPQKLDITCDWIWSHGQLSTWVDSSQGGPSDYSQRLICLYGPKGCGKTVLSASIADTLQAQDKVSTFFSFWAGSESQRKFAGFLKTTLWQLLKHLSAEDMPQVSSVLMRTSSYDERSLREALDFTVKTIKSEVYMIIDGIDEAEKDWNDSEDQSLSTIVNILKTHANAHILLCGRETSLSRAIISSSASLKISQEFLRNDINTLIEWHLNNSSKPHITLSKDLVRESLQAKSEMMFLWVNLVFKELNRSPSTSAMRAILSNTPPTLDAEYNRMFESLMKRLGGSSTRPSITMKTVKRILALILASPEPLTLVELGYACAADTAISSAQDYELLTREGLIDLCGDFIDEFNGHFHFIHASIAEFFTRPTDQWNQADSNILYFRVDRLKSQAFLLESCFNYIRSMEMGYPIHDRSMQSLLESYPFFQYASRFLPVLLASAMPVVTNSILEQFIACKQFCGLVEYVVHTLEMDSWDLFLQYLDLLHSLNDFRISASTLTEAANVELDRREQQLGEDDPRYQTWASLCGMLSSYLACIDRGDGQQDAPSIHTRRLTAQPSTHVSTLTVRATGVNAVANHGAILAQLRPNISALLQFRLLESLKSVPIAILPTWLLILWALQTWNGDNENSSRATPMLETALRRVRKRRNFTESVCLLYLGIMEDHKAQTEHDIDKCSMHCWFQESLGIARNLPSSPQVDAVIQRALCGLTEALLLHNDRQNAMLFSRQLEHSVCNNETVEDDSGWLKRMLYRGSAWAKWKILVLGIHRATLEKYRINKDVERINQFALNLHTERHWAQIPSILEWRWSMSRILWLSRKIEECRTSSQVILEHLQGLKGTQYHAEYWVKTVSLLTDCLLEQNKDQEARQWLLQMPIALILQEPEATHIGISLLKVGCIDRALELCKCWGRENLMKDLRLLRWDRLVGERTAERMFETGIDARMDLGTIALFYASSKGKASVAEFLLAQGVQLEFQYDPEQVTPFSAAVREGNVSIVKLLLDKGAEYDWTKPFVTKAWSSAIAHGQSLEVETFLKAGINVNRQLPNEATPLTLAATQGHDLVVKLILDYGADKERPDSDGWTPLTIAASEGHVKVVQLLLDHGADKERPDPDGWTPLTIAASKGYNTVIQLLLDHGADKDHQISYGGTPLTLAATHGHSRVVQLLLDYGADNDRPDSDGWTPLTIAASEGHVKVVQLLLDYGANKDHQVSHGGTPLTLAAEHGYNTIVWMLLDYGADKDRPDSDGWTPLTIAASKGYDTVLRLLLDYGADKNSRDSWEWTPLEMAVGKGHGTVVKLLLDCGADTNDRDGDGYTLLAHARRAGQTEMVRLLLDHGVQNDESDAKGDTSGWEERDSESNGPGSEVVEWDSDGELRSISS